MRSFFFGSVVVLSSSLALAVACGSDNGGSGGSSGAGNGDAGASAGGDSSKAGGAGETSSGATSGDAGSSGATMSEAGSGDSSSGGAMSSGGATNAGAGGGGTKPAGLTDGPSAACLAAVKAWKPCGGTLVPGTYKVSDVSCSDSSTISHGPGCQTAGVQQVWYEGALVGDFQLSMSETGSGIKFDNAGARKHVEGTAPRDCAKAGATECALAYFAAPTNPHGDCKVEGDTCHCNWYTDSSGIMGGGGNYTVSGNTLTYGSAAFHVDVPYCVDGDTVTLDVSAGFPDAGKPLIIKGVKQP